jgi:glycosyltransferase involved in cell wall biosynthesis
MKLSIIIPVYNEKNTILQLLEKVENVKLPVEKEVIIVDDGSTDGTLELLRRLNRHILLCHPKNYGKGTAIRTALKHISGDIILIQDGDLEYDPAEYPKLIEPILQQRAKIVYGCRFSKNHKPKYPIYYLGNKFLSFLTYILYGSKVIDIETCYKVFTKDILESINLDAKRFDFEPEITVKFLKKGYKIYEVPISYKCRAIEEGKKITAKDGLIAIWILLKYRFCD